MQKWLYFRFVHFDLFIKCVKAACACCIYAGALASRSTVWIVTHCFNGVALRFLEYNCDRCLCRRRVPVRRIAAGPTSHWRPRCSGQHRVRSRTVLCVCVQHSGFADRRPEEPAGIAERRCGPRYTILDGRWQHRIADIAIHLFAFLLFHHRFILSGRARWQHPHRHLHRRSDQRIQCCRREDPIGACTCRRAGRASRGRCRCPRTTILGRRNMNNVHVNEKT